MSVSHSTISLKSKGFCDIVDITRWVEEAVSASNVRDGLVNVFVPGSTGGITTIEYESGLVDDLKDLFEQIAPRDGDYQHNLRWGDGNGFAHVRAALLGPSLTVPVADGRLQHGTWQQIVFMDFDNRERNRDLLVTIMGE
jgi:secondary thiamine-phosphate synthase enzyme